MLDIQLLRDDPDKVKKGVAAKGYDANLVDKVLKVDEQYKKLLQEVEELRAQKNKAAKEKDIEQGKLVKAQLQKKEPELEAVEKEYNEALLGIPNLPADDVPEGDASKFDILDVHGEPRKFEFIPRDHLEIGELLDIIDVKTAAKVSGSRFSYLKNEAVLLELALVNFAFNQLQKEGFTPIIPPAIIKKEITSSLGYWNGKIDEKHTANENYYLVHAPSEEDPQDDPSMYLIGTGEHALVPMHKDETLQGNKLPLRYAAFSPCFRREAGTYGKDTKGILRVHQFDKVEMVVFVKPENDETERRKLLKISEGLMQSLELPYRTVKLASGDLGFPAAETIDIETWIPSQNKYRETHSISTTTDFQARGFNIKYDESGGTEYVHILNGTAFAIGRTIIAILENFQEEDGSVKVPEILQKYTGFSEIRNK